MATKTKATTVAVLLIQGDFEVHKAGCAGMKAVMPNVSNYFTHSVAKGDTQFDVIASLWDDQIAEATGPGNHYATVADAVHSSFQYATKFHDCVAGIIGPMPTPGEIAAEPAKAKAKAKAKPKPKPSPAPKATGNGSLTREQKRQLANAVVSAASSVLSGLDYAGLKGVDPKLAGQTVAQWLHHLPVDRSAWPTALPKPDRSDWR